MAGSEPDSPCQTNNQAKPRESDYFLPVERQELFILDADVLRCVSPTFSAPKLVFSLSSAFWSWAVLAGVLWCLVVV